MARTIKSNGNRQDKRTALKREKARRDLRKNTRNA